jgi:hypothetical protein
MKGQDVPHLHGEKKILQDFKVLVNGTGPTYNYDDLSAHDNNDKAFDSNNPIGGYLDPE